jgi:hypothetical protein
MLVFCWGWLFSNVVTLVWLYSPLVGRQGGGEERSGTPTAAEKNILQMEILFLKKLNVVLIIQV